MQITIHHIAPVFLEKEKIGRSEIWNKEISFSKGEHIQLVAPSGSGKTSFIHFLYGMRKDYTGDVSIGGLSIRQAGSEKLAVVREKTISIVFQDLRLFTAHSAFENIEVKRQLSPFHDAERIKEMAAALGVAEKLEQQAGKCSYGEQQRIAIIRALQQPFDFIILDEPFSHLDLENSKKAMQLISEEAGKRQAGIILADLEPVPFFDAQKTFYL
ncbi:MAG: ATP-binding cassette domain-containing protein [Ferruginibacter sp.]